MATDGSQYRSKGCSVPAGRIYMRKTLCPQGHPYSGENLAKGASGENLCRTCAREKSRRYRAARAKDTRPAWVRALDVSDQGPVICVPLGDGRHGLIDASDLPLVARSTWRIGRSGYVTNAYQYMHRLLMGLPKGLQVDHINGDKLDNRRSNLRLADRSENQGNRATNSSTVSGFKGVTWAKSRGTWRADITRHGRQHFLGYHADPVVAAQAYDEAAVSLFGEFARLNPPGVGA